MLAHSRKKKSTYLKGAQVAISNTLADAEILMFVGAYGYTATSLQEGQRLCDAAVRAVNAQTAANGAQLLMAEQVREAKRQAGASFQALAQLIRAVFGNRSAQCATLGLVGPMPQGINDFLVIAAKLFDNVGTNAEISRKLASHGYDSGRLERERAVIDNYDQSYKAYVAAKGAAQQATRDQHAALVALQGWLAQYLKIAKIALRDKPDLLEKIGGSVRASRTAAQRGAGKKAAATRAANQGT